MLNLCFHGIGPPRRKLETGEAPYWVTPEFFLAVLDEVVGRADVRLSFDDGNDSDFVHGLPALRSRGLVATFFVLAGRVDERGSLSTAALRELRAAGMAIGSHGMHHVPWRHLDMGGRREELVEARELLRAASAGPVDEAALPLGRYDRQVLGWLRRAGYRRVYSSDRLPTAPDRWLQPRYSLRADDSLASVRRVLAGPGALPWMNGTVRMALKRLR